MTALYETTVDDVRVVRDLEFTVQDSLNAIYNNRDLFRDITLILDIDFTLGEAVMLDLNVDSGHSNKNITMVNGNNKHQTTMENLQRLYQLGKIDWFHNGTCAFFIRPYFEHFIYFCIHNFKEVIIWTNGVQRHADNMVSLIYKITGQKLRGFGRDYSTNDVKLVEKIGLDPKTVWMVDDDHRHHQKASDKYNVNPEIKFFHTPEFSLTWFKDFTDTIARWHCEHPDYVLELYDDWFLFLVWNWVYMKDNKINMEKFCRNDYKFSH
jgi:hypothetical protein